MNSVGEYPLQSRQVKLGIEIDHVCASAHIKLTEKEKRLQGADPEVEEAYKKVITILEDIGEGVV